MLRKEATEVTEKHREDAREAFINHVLRLVARHDIHNSLFWTSDLKFCVNVNDVFWWGTGDAEEITPENINALEQAILDCEKACDIGEVYGGWLFAARNRKLRPQGASYPEERELWPLFDACGPERTTGHGNPYKPGGYKPRTPLASRDAETREVLEGLAVKHYVSLGEYCWCRAPGTATKPAGDYHTPACLAARGLWNRLQS